MFAARFAFGAVARCGFLRRADDCVRGLAFLTLVATATTAAATLARRFAVQCGSGIAGSRRCRRDGRRLLRLRGRITTALFAVPASTARALSFAARPFAATFAAASIARAARA
ncbi:MAG: hypothetical protein KF759_04020 [Dokdonella sp.]|nr:hypothetical protein [Dokdonella sp.]